MNRIELLRKKKKLSQQEVCERIGVSQKTYYNYVHRNIVPSDVLIHLSELFECSTDYLLGLSNYTSIIVTDLNDKVLAVIDNKKVVEHSEFKVIFSED